MPPRLSHRKSTKGCQRCKARKVKCDEQQPKCSHCKRHGVSCEYLSLATRAYVPSQISKATSQRSSQPGPTSGLGSPDMGALRIMDLRLMHHYTTQTAQTMSSAQLPSVGAMWSMTVPQMAFEYLPLLHTLLAIGAAHRSTMVPGEANKLRPVHHGYIDSSLQRHRALTSHVTGPEVESVCINAILISLYTMFLRTEPSTGPYEPPILWLSVARGVRVILQSVYWTLLNSKSSLCPLFFAQPSIWNKDPNCTFHDLPTKPFQFLLHYRREEEEWCNETSEAYSRSVGYLEMMFLAVSGEQPDSVIRRILNGFPPMVPSQFMHLASERRPRALVILAYLFAMAKTSEDMWWLKGTPGREVHGIDSILPIEWKWAMSWPLRLISASPETRCYEIPLPVTCSPPSPASTV
ncbi:hypothetical protein N7510_001994 [Penicillium lagena]|uniref:uncharacterized protein n=1 Tax=Penicillium lagena TaxID=94218 RepID=UPI002540CC7B|nr:uncharacterized protein N7510_001994 [Penicillium lagena]KAJ5625685.1 hypothetical protein N7510_001994 [Penicillium lagena]